MKPYFHILFLSTALACLATAFWLARTELMFGLPLFILSAPLFFRGVPGSETLRGFVLVGLGFVYFGLIILLSETRPDDLVHDATYIPMYQGNIEWFEIGAPGTRGGKPHADIRLGGESTPFRILGENFAAWSDVFKRLYVGESIRLWCFRDLIRSEVCRVRQLQYQGKTMLPLADFNERQTRHTSKNRYAGKILIVVGVLWTVAGTFATLYAYLNAPKQLRPLPLPRVDRQQNQRDYLISALLLLSLGAIGGVVLWLQHFPRQVFEVAGGYIITVALAGSGVVFLRLRKQGEALFTRLLVSCSSALYLAAITYSVVLVMNVLLPAQSETAYTGRVKTKIFRAADRFSTIDSYCLELEAPGKYSFGPQFPVLRLRLPISAEEYRQSRLDAPYHYRMKRGGLGLEYAPGNVTCPFSARRLG